MIAKIVRSSNLFGTLNYNNSKMQAEKGKILLTNKIIETSTGAYSVSQLSRSFDPYLLANRNTKKHTLHISLNPDPTDQMTDERYIEVAQQYMQEMGFGQQPYVVFKHTDIERSHIHIVSVCVDDEGRKISDQFENIRSMKVCRELEKKFQLINATDKKHSHNRKIFQPVDYKKGYIKTQIASVVRHLSNYYHYQTFGEYNALLSLFNITAVKVEGELHGKVSNGLVYIPLNEKGEKTGHPFKASLFGKNAGLPAVESHCAKNKGTLKDHPAKSTVKAAVTIVLQSTNDEQAFKKNLKKEGIDTIVLKNDSDRIYGITFIDHPSKTVWNGSRLGKECSANVFQNHWSQEDGKNSKDRRLPNPKTSLPNDLDRKSVNTDPVCDISKYHENNIFDFLSGILPSALGEDQEENEFADQMKRRKKRYRRK